MRIVDNMLLSCQILVKYKKILAMASKGGCRIVAIMCPCQGQDGSSILLTRSMTVDTLSDQALF